MTNAIEGALTPNLTNVKVSVQVKLRTKFKNENEQRAKTPKVWNFELWFLCTALHHNEIYLPMKFHVDALHSFKVMLWTKKRRTDWRTDESITSRAYKGRNLKIFYHGFLPFAPKVWTKIDLSFLDKPFYQFTTNLTGVFCVSLALLLLNS